MVTASQRQFIYAQAGWTVAGIVLLAAVGSLSLETVFVVSFLGFALVTALTVPLRERPAWRSWLRWPLAVGTILFLVIVGMRTLEKFVGSL